MTQKTSSISHFIPLALFLNFHNICILTTFAKLCHSRVLHRSQFATFFLQWYYPIFFFPVLTAIFLPFWLEQSQPQIGKLIKIIARKKLEIDSWIKNVFCLPHSLILKWNRHSCLVFFARDCRLKMVAPLLYLALVHRCVGFCLKIDHRVKLASSIIQIMWAPIVMLSGFFLKSCSVFNCIYW